MKNHLRFAIILVAIFLNASCNKEDGNDPINQPDTYSSTSQFLAANAVPLQTFVINATTGGTFTTSQGTEVIIPANAFITQSGSPVTGSVQIKFKDVYKKSDMLFDKLSTHMLFGGPIKSAGMFFIKAGQGSQEVILDAGKKITVNQPLNGLPLDTQMVALDMARDSIDVGWVFPPMGTPSNPANSIIYTATDYVFSFYQFSTPLDSGTWCNSDNPGYFSGNPITTLTLNPLDNANTFQTDVFLLFNNVNSMIHVYRSGATFKYYYAPQGSQCTMVAVGVKDGKLYASFKPVTITNNLTVNFTLTETTLDLFKTQLNLLN
ncbi:MAG TPA: hypothetical protein PKD91_03525 [Bacteroidia bacterium]|nr:hypothetical protein [Bacteroidia bacterium]